MKNNNKSSPSLSEVHRSVSIPKNVGVLKRFFAFLGPAYLVSVGYMDPGNWATDLEGGARFGYSLIWVLLMSNLMAILLQTLSARLGIVTGRDLAQACRENYPKPVSIILWILCEVAIAATDLAEVLGTAIGLNLLLNIPLLYGVIITGFDTLLFLIIQNFGIRKVEAFIVMMISTIGICFGIEVFLSEPVWGDVAKGFVPRLTPESLYVAIGILGATVMPHNLYLHSALVQTRDVCASDDCKRQACKWNLLDTTFALNAAFFVNAAILIVAGSVFFRNNIIVTEIQQAHHLLTPLLGTTLASTLFALALLSAGQSSTLTGTLAGQIVMEGFLQFKMRPVLRRLITRMLAIVPAVIVILWKGDEGSYSLLIFSQVILSLQLPFAVIPLINFTTDKIKMGSFANKPIVIILAWITAVIIIVLNARLLWWTVADWIAQAGSAAIWIWIIAVPFIIGCTLLLMYMAFPKLWRRRRKVSMPIPKLSLSHQTYTRIGVALDFSGMEEKILSHAQSIAQHHNAAIYLFHVVEGVSGQIFGKEAFDEEARTDKEHIDNVAEQLRAFGFEVYAHLGFGNVPQQLVKLANETQIDLLIMGGHRHSGWKDILFGTTVPKVRHSLKIPVLVV
ncbi:MAG: Nramp family divalent metal transporter [Ignavibacteriales bacterium]|nr:Nramp family divalent metal transporter [Ignavibacteriales bacterium]